MPLRWEGCLYHGVVKLSVKQEILAHMRDGRETWLQRHIRKCQNQDLHAVRSTVLDGC